MKLTPRGAEVKAVVELLESDEFESANALAKAILKHVADMLSDRDFYAWVYRETPDAFYIPFGPFTSESEAKKFAGKYVDALKGQHMILPLYSTNEFVNRLASHKLPNYHCTSCTHTLTAHEHPRKNGKCVVRGCSCKKATAE